MGAGRPVGFFPPPLQGRRPDSGAEGERRDHHRDTVSKMKERSEHIPISVKPRKTVRDDLTSKRARTGHMHASDVVVDWEARSGSADRRHKNQISFLSIVSIRLFF